MTKLEEIKKDIEKLSPDEYMKFKGWFDGYIDELKTETKDITVDLDEKKKV